MPSVHEGGSLAGNVSARVRSISASLISPPTRPRVSGTSRFLSSAIAAAFHQRIRVARSPPPNSSCRCSWLLVCSTHPHTSEPPSVRPDRSLQRPHAISVFTFELLGYLA